MGVTLMSHYFHGLIKIFLLSLKFHSTFGRCRSYVYLDGAIVRTTALADEVDVALLSPTPSLHETSLQIHLLWVLRKHVLLMH